MASEFSNIEIYSGQTLEDLFKQIHSNSNNTSSQITKLIRKLSELVKSTDDAAILVPLIAEYLEVSVKNDDQLIKLAGIVQRFVKSQNTAKDNDDNFLGLTPEEREEIISNADFFTGKMIESGKK